MQDTIERKRRVAGGGGGDRVIRLYLNDISKIPLLTVEEERELGKRIQSGDLLARQKLIESNLRFVVNIAKKFSRSADQLMDLVNAGNVGLVEAAQRFDPAMNVKFISYAVWWIRQAIFDQLSGMTHPFRVTSKTAILLYRMRRALNCTSAGSEETLERKHLAEQVGVTLRELNWAFDALVATVSLDEPAHEDGDSRMSDLIEQRGSLSADKQALIQSIRRSLQRSIEKLSPVEQWVIQHRFGLNDQTPMTLKQLGDQLKRSRERIRQIEMTALNKLHKIYAPQTLHTYLN